MGRGAFLYLASLGAHGVLALGVYAIPSKKSTTATPVTFVSSPPKKAERPKDTPKPPEATATPAPKAAKSAPSPVQNTPIANKAAPRPEAPAPAPPDFGVTLGGGGGGGAAIAGGGGGAPGGNGPGPAPAETVRKVLAAPPRAEGGCDEAAKKPKPIAVPQPAYTDAARAAGISGRVRVEITVDERGRVANVRVLEGLGHGLDEAALAAARAATFEAATRCGKPVAATFTVSMRFSL